MSDDEAQKPPQAQSIPKTLREAADEFHMWMGMCIAQWANVEATIFRVFWQSLACPEERAAIVYFRSPSTETRMKLTQELVASVLPKTASGKQPHDDLKAWKEIVRIFEDLRPIRNRIAHHPVAPRASMMSGTWCDAPFGSVPYGAGIVTDYWYENYVSPEEQLRGQREQPPPLGVADLKAHYLATMGLTEALNAFLDQRLTAHL
jgi:hypothetical protein